VSGIVATVLADVVESEQHFGRGGAEEEGSTMRRAIALLLGVLLPILGLADAGLAQSAVSIPGTIQAVNCQNHTVVLSGAGGANTLAATNSTAVVVNSTSVPFCTLQQYVGDSATAWVVPSGNEFLMTRIDVVGPATSAAAPAPAPAVSSPSTLGIVLGALAVGAIGYFIGRSSANQQPAYQPAYQDQPVYQPGYQYGPYQYSPYQYGPYQYDQYQYDHGRWVPRYDNRQYQEYYQRCGAPSWNNRRCWQRKGDREHEH
jgi:hypothetical protein